MVKQQSSNRQSPEQQSAVAPRFAVPFEKAVYEVRRGHAMAIVLNNYYTSELATQAPLREETLYEYCGVMSDLLRSAMATLDAMHDAPASEGSRHD